jgi:D-hydroxyproline dehydrogenase subunit gamma
MHEQIAVKVNGVSVSVSSGTTAAVALMIAGQPCRTSVIGELRGPLCSMGICFECRATINGVRHCRSCQIPCKDGMEITTDN